MAERKAIGYFRISGQAGAHMRADLEGQREAMRAHAAAEGLRIVEECVDYQNGNRAARPQWKRALALCKSSQAVLVIPKVGPLARDPAFYIDLHMTDIDFQTLDRPDITRATLLSLGKEAHAQDPRRKVQSA
jgi:DNA invertase Pin-like site-specific DNA recombinase